MLDVVAGGLGRDHKPLADLLVGEPAREQHKDLDLARGEACRPFAAVRDAVASDAENRLHGIRVKAPRFDVGAELGGGRVG
jgi:hypothetical protein